uniref:hypothetical protein n=1 Tax=Alloprevotella sp. TaxID=1872471 RepID=UPI003FEDA052
MDKINKLNEAARVIRKINAKAKKNLLSGEPVYLQSEAKLSVYRNEVKNATKSLTDDDWLDLSIIDPMAVSIYDAMMLKGYGA